MNSHASIQDYIEKMGLKYYEDLDLWMNDHTKKYAKISDEVIVGSGYYFHTMGRLCLDGNYLVHNDSFPLNKASVLALSQSNGAYMLTPIESVKFETYARNKGEDFKIHRIMNWDYFTDDSNLIWLTLSNYDNIKMFKDAIACFPREW